MDAADLLRQIAADVEAYGRSGNPSSGRTALKKGDFVGRAPVTLLDWTIVVLRRVPAMILPES